MDQGINPNIIRSGNAMLDAALQYAAQGHKVFPCWPLLKTPMTPNGFYDASSDPNVIRGWWQNVSDANIGLRLDGSGITVIDTDPPDGEDNLAALERKHGPLPRTYMARSPRGGWHRYFRGTVPNRAAGTLAPHIDSKSTGGYVLAPPSVTSHGTYQRGHGTMADLPSWVSVALAKRSHAVLTAPAGVVVDAPHMLRQMTDWLRHHASVIEGEHSDSGLIPVFGWLGDHGIDPDTAVALVGEHLRMRREDGGSFDTEYLEAKAASAYRSRQNAFGGRYQPKPAPGTETFAEALAKLPAQPASGAILAVLPDDEDDECEGADKFVSIPLDAYDDLPQPTYWDPEYRLFPKVIGGSRILIAGGYSSHKTNFALFQCVNALREHPTARVIYCAGEAHVELLQQRIPAICQALKISRQELVGRLEVVKACPTLSDPCDVAHLLSTQDAFAKGADGNLIVIIDTLAEALTGQDENATAVGTLAMQQAARIKRRWGCLVALVHHFGKDASKGSRGSIVFPSNADAVLELTFDRTAATVKIWVDKMRGGKDKREVVLGTIIMDLSPDGTGGGDLGTMTVVRLTPEARQAAAAKAAKAERNPLVAFIRAVLRDGGAVDEDHSWSRDHLAETLAATGTPSDAVGEGQSRRAVAARADWAKHLPTAKAQWKAKLHDGVKTGTEAKPRRAAFGGLFRRLSWPLDGQDHLLEDRWFVAPIAAGDEA